MKKKRESTFIHSVALLPWSGSIGVLSLLLFLVHFICSIDTVFMNIFVELCVVWNGGKPLVSCDVSLELGFEVSPSTM